MSRGSRRPEVGCCQGGRGPRRYAKPDGVARCNGGAGACTDGCPAVARRADRLRPCRPRRADPAESMTHYEFLGVPTDATTSQITKAFHRLARRVHPDVGGNADDFAALEEAWGAFLSSPELRGPPTTPPSPMRTGRCGTGSAGARRSMSTRPPAARAVGGVTNPRSPREASLRPSPTRPLRLPTRAGPRRCGRTSLRSTTGTIPPGPWGRPHDAPGRGGERVDPSAPGAVPQAGPVRRRPGHLGCPPTQPWSVRAGGPHGRGSCGRRYGVDRGPGRVASFWDAPPPCAGRASCSGSRWWRCSAARSGGSGSALVLLAVLCTAGVAVLVGNAALRDVEVSTLGALVVRSRRRRCSPRSC